jgi:glycosyltransferase involved in cell wall biosynthesis
VLKILCVTPFYKPAFVYGGPTRSIPALCEGLAGCGCEVSVYTTNANGKAKLSVEAGKEQVLDGVKVTYFERSGIPGYFYSRDLAAACRNGLNRYDLISITGNWVHPLLPVCREALKWSVPYVISPRTSFMRKAWKYGSLKKLVYHLTFERRLVNGAAAIHYTSELERTESAWLRLRPPNFIIPNAVDLDELDPAPERGAFRAKWRITDNEKIILYLGRLEPRKGLELTLRGFASACRLGLAGTTLIFAGPEKRNYRHVLQKCAAALGVENKVLFPGYLNAGERLSALMDADLFVLLSYGENFGMALVEAMALGVVPLISDQVGIADDISKAKAGIVVPLDPDRIASELRGILTAPDAQRHCSGNARTFVRENYESRKVARATLQEYGKFCAPATGFAKDGSAGLCDTLS